MSLIPVNLATRPFRNERPVTRLAILLWAAGALFLGINVWLYWTYYAGSGEIAERMTEITAETAAENQRIQESERRVAGMELDQQNEVADYLNLKIAERTFGWSRLFDHLAEVLPNDVRLLSLSPSAASDERNRRGADGDEPETVRLGIRGEAKTDEALLTLIDGLFDHPAFARPNLSREAPSGRHPVPDAGPLRGVLAGGGRTGGRGAGERRAGRRRGQRRSRGRRR